jgi:hypothetical protein
MAPRELTMEILVDTSPLLTFTHLVQRALETIEAPLDLGDFPLDPVRLQDDPRPAGADHLLMRFYPSDRLLDFTAAIFAGNLNVGFIEETGHNKPPKEKKECHLKK